MSVERNATEAVGEIVLDYLRQTPKAVGVLLASFFSGHLWVFMVLAIRTKTRGNTFLQPPIGRTALGLCWFTMIHLPLYFAKFRELDFKYNKMMQLAIPTVLFGLAIQVVLFAVFVRYGDKK